MRSFNEYANIFGTLLICFFSVVVVILMLLGSAFDNMAIGNGVFLLSTVVGAILVFVPLVLIDFLEEMVKKFVNKTKKNR